MSFDVEDEGMDRGRRVGDYWNTKRREEHGDGGIQKREEEHVDGTLTCGMAGVYLDLDDTL